MFNIAHNDVPDPATGVRGLKIGTLKNGSQVYSGVPCKNGWCQVNSSVIQGGNGFVEQAHLSSHKSDLEGRTRRPCWSVSLRARRSSSLTMSSRSLLPVNGFGGWEPHSVGVNCAKGYVVQPDCRTRGVHAGQAGEPMT
jgi:hypothetical protein